VRFIKAFPGADGNCCEDMVRDDVCDSCCPATVDFEISSEEIGNALWNLSAENTSSGSVADFVWSWQVTVEVDHVTYFIHEHTGTDLPEFEVSGICDADIDYTIFLICRTPSGDFCALQVKTFTATGWNRSDFPTISAPEIAAVFTNDGSIPASAGFIGDTFTWNGAIWEGESVPAANFLLGARILTPCGLGSPCGAPHAECDSILRGATIDVFSIKSGAQRTVHYGNKTPNDVSPFGIYTLISYDPVLAVPPGTITITP